MRKGFIKSDKTNCSPLPFFRFKKPSDTISWRYLDYKTLSPWPCTPHWQVAVDFKNSGFRRLRYIFSSFGCATSLLRQTTGSSSFPGCISVSQVTTQEITTSVTQASLEPVTNTQTTFNTAISKIEQNWCTGTSDQAESVGDKTEVHISRPLRQHLLLPAGFSYSSWRDSFSSIFTPSLCATEGLLAVLYLLL